MEHKDQSGKSPGAGDTSTQRYRAAPVAPQEHKPSSTTLHGNTGNKAEMTKHEAGLVFTYSPDLQVNTEHFVCRFLANKNTTVPARTGTQIPKHQSCHLEREWLEQQCQAAITCQAHSSVATYKALAKQQELEMPGKKSSFTLQSHPGQVLSPAHSLHCSEQLPLRQSDRQGGLRPHLPLETCLGGLQLQRLATEEGRFWGRLENRSRRDS